MQTLLKQSIIGGLSFLLLTGIVFSVGSSEPSVFQGQANVNERSAEFLYSNLSGGTFANSSTYITADTTTNPCNFQVTGGFNRAGTTPKFAFGLTNTATISTIANQTPSITITKASYILELTAIEILAYSASGNNRQLRINGVDDDTNVTSAGTWDSPINIGKISLTAGSSSVTITSPDGSILIKTIILYFI